MRYTTYHMLLRVSALTLALVLLFVSGVLVPNTSRIAEQTGVYLSAAVGMNASVVPTEINSLTAELTQKRDELARREAELAEREIAVTLNTDGGSSLSSTFILSILLFILLVLIVLNYSLDYIRAREMRLANSHEKAA